MADSVGSGSAGAPRGVDRSSFTWWVRKRRNVISLAAAAAFFTAARPTPRSLLYGLALIVIGEAVRLWSAGHIHKASELTVTGPYSLSRNPLYVGSFVMGFGFMIAMGRWWLLLMFLVFFFTVYFFTIRAEEGFLAARFPEQWEEYSSRVPRVVPIVRRPRYRKGTFRWSQAARNREILNAAVVLCVYGLLWMKLIF